MKAIRLDSHGGVENLGYGDVPDPACGPGEVRVRVQACAVNHLDIWVRKGMPSLRLPLPHVLGCDVAGVIESVGVGAGTAGWEIGQPVVIAPGTSCGHCMRCLDGDDNLCREYRILGEHRWGGYAELVSVPAANVLPKPARLSWPEAAAMPLVFLTAWNMLVRKARVQPGDWVLVHAAGSGVGSAGLQIAKLHGATVVATASSDDKLERARALGADHLVNSKTQDVVAETRRLTDKRGVDIVFEHVGVATWNQSVLAVRRGGTILTCGATSGSDVQLDLKHVFYRQLQIRGSTMGRRADLFRILEHAEAGLLRPVVDSVLPLAEAADAHRRLEQRKVFGKVVLTPPGLQPLGKAETASTYA